MYWKSVKYLITLFTRSLETGILFESGRTPPLSLIGRGRPGWTGGGDNSAVGKSGGVTWQNTQGERQEFLTMAGTKTLLMLENYIGGKFLPCNSYIDSYDPSTGEVYCRVPDSGKEEVSVFTHESEMV